LQGFLHSAIPVADCFLIEGPDPPNGSENDIRSHVTKRKISGGTRSDAGRDCRDAFLGFAKPAPSSKSHSGITLAIDSPNQLRPFPLERGVAVAPGAALSAHRIARHPCQTL